MNYSAYYEFLCFEVWSCDYLKIFVLNVIVNMLINFSRLFLILCSLILCFGFICKFIKI